MCLMGLGGGLGRSGVVGTYVQDFFPFLLLILPSPKLLLLELVAFGPSLDSSWWLLLSQRNAPITPISSLHPPISCSAVITSPGLAVCSASTSSGQGSTLFLPFTPTTSATTHDKTSIFLVTLHNPPSVPRLLIHLEACDNPASRLSGQVQPSYPPARHSLSAFAILRASVPFLPCTQPSLQVAYERLDKLATPSLACFTLLRSRL
ncbi:hypothetical protein VTO58DRAFT_109888 [Aureobasidium pullulans]